MYRALPRLLLLSLLLPLFSSAGIAGDVLPPNEVVNLTAALSGDDVVLSWDAVSTDVLGQAEVVTAYRVYRGTVGSFVADKLGGSNRVGEPSTTDFTDASAALDPDPLFYLVSAVDAAGNEGNVRPSAVETAPVLGGSFSATSANLLWSGASPPEEIAGYQVVWGTASGSFGEADDVGDTDSTSVYPLVPGLTYYFSVFAYDAERNLGPISNELSGQLGSGGPGTEVCGRIDSDTTWAMADSPFVVTCNVEVYGDTGPFRSGSPATLTIEPGVVVKFEPLTGLSIGNGANLGGLVAQGTMSDPIVFTANQTFPLPGAWNGISFADGTLEPTSIIEWAAIEFAGSSFGAAITLNSAEPTIRETVIRGSLNHGVNLLGTSAPLLERLTIENVAGNGVRVPSNVSPTIRESTMSDIGDHAIYFAGATSAIVEDNVLEHGFFFNSASGDPQVTGNTLTRYADMPSRLGADDVGEILTTGVFSGANGSSRLEILGERLSTDATWTDPGFPLVALSGTIQPYGDTVVPVTLTIGAGAELRFNLSTRIQVGSGANRGGLVAVGTPSEPILFTTNNPVPAPGQWQTIYFDDGTVDGASVLDHCVVEYGGQSYSTNIRVVSASPTIRNTTIRHGSVHGIYATGTSDMTVESSSITSVADRGIFTTGNPTLSGNTIASLGDYGIYVSGVTSAQITGNVVDNSIYFDNAGGDPTLSGNTFASLDLYPPRVGAADVEEFLTQNTLQGASPAGRLEVLGEVLSVDTTWPNPGFPYAILGNVTVAKDLATAATLTIGPGSTLRFNLSTRLQIGSGALRGSLVAIGTPSEPITFTTNNPAPAPGQWQTIYFDDGTVDVVSVLDHCVVEYGGQSYSSNIRVVNASPTIRNTTIRHGSVHGIYATGTSDTTVLNSSITSVANRGIFTTGNPTLTGNTIASLGDYGIYVSGVNSAQITGNVVDNSIFFDNAGGDPTLSGNTFANLDSFPPRVGAGDVGEFAADNILQGASPAGRLEVLGETLSLDATWPNPELLYVILGNVTVAKDATTAATLTISPGATLRFNSSVGLLVGTSTLKGALVAVGTPSEPITFTTNNDTPAPGQWRAVYFQDGSVDATSILDHCIVEYGGQTYSASIRVVSASPTIRNTVVRYGSAHGIYATGTSDMIVEDSTITSMANRGIFTTGNPVLSGNTIDMLGDYGIYISGATSAEVTDNVVENSIFFDNAGGDPTITENIITNYDPFPARVGAGDVEEFLTENTLGGATSAGRLDVLGETLDTDATWPDPGFPLAALANIVVAKDATTPATLTLGAGMTIGFNSSTGLLVGTTVSQGALVAVGTPAEPITFTTNNASPAPGQWRAVYFDSASVDATSILDNCIVEYGGQTYSANVRVVSASPTIRNTTVRDGSANGIYATGTSDMTVEGSTISSVASEGINTTGNPTLIGNMILSPGRYGIYLSSTPNAVVNLNMITTPGDFGIYVSGTNSALIEDNTVDNSIYFTSATGDPTITGNTFSNYDPFPARLGADDVGEFLTLNTINGATPAGRLEVLGETVATDASWPDPGFPLVALANITVAKDVAFPSTLTLGEGLALRFNSNAGLFVGTTTLKGSLVALGTPSEPITFTTNNETPAPGQWRGVYFDSASDDATSVLDHCVVEYGGQTYSANVRLAGSAPTIRNSTIRQSSVYGLYGTSFSSPTLEDNVFSDHANFDALLSGGSDAVVTGNTFAQGLRFDSATGQPTVQNNTFDNYLDPYVLRIPADSVTSLTGNVFNDTDATSRIEVLGETLTGDHQWADLDLPYDVMTTNVTVRGTFTVPAGLTIDPGVTIRFGSNRQLVIASSNTQGRLIAQGTPAEPITFTSDSETPAAGDWLGLYLLDGTTLDSVIENAVVEYAGSGSWAGIYINDAAMEIRDTVIRFSANYGLYSTSSSDVLENLTVENTGSNGLYFNSTAAPTVTGCTISAPTGYGIYNNGTLSTSISGCTVDNSIYFSSAAGEPSVQGTILNDVDAFPLRIGASSIGSLTGNTFNDTTADSIIEVLGEVVTADATWANLTVPYRVTTGNIIVAGSSSVPATLTIAPGTTLEFDPSRYLQVSSSSNLGALMAAGTSGDPITFTTSNETPAPGQWSGIYFNSATVDETSLLDHCVVEYAGQSNDGNVTVSNANPTITNCTIRQSNADGIRVSSASPTIGFNSLVDNTGYGVNVLNSAAGPTVQHNSLTGNGLGGVGRNVTSNIDARLNWYGDASGPSGEGPGTGQSVATGIVYSPWLGSPHTADNYFSDMFSTTPTFQPGSFTRFVGAVAQDSSWTLEILDTGDAVVRTINGSGGSFTVDWDGTDDVAAALPDGPYTFRFGATADGTSDVAAPAIGLLELDQTFAIGELVDPMHLETVSIGTGVSIDGSAAGSNFTNYDLQYGAGLFPTSYVTFASSAAPVTAGTLGTWNTTGLNNGIYALRLLVDNDIAEETVVNLGSFVLSVNTLSVDRVAFSPNGDGSIDEVTASATLSTEADWTLDVVQDGTEMIVRTFAGSGTGVTQSWNGTLSDGMTVAAEGDYRFDLIAMQGGEMVASSSSLTELDVTPPAAAISDPMEAGQVFGDVAIIGDAFDPAGSFQDYVLEFGVGQEPLSYTQITSSSTPVTADLLGTWVTNDSEPVEPIPNGGYQIRLTANDVAGNSAVGERQIGVDNLVLGGVSVSTVTLDTFQGETTQVDFALNRAADVTLSIHPEPDGAAGVALWSDTQSFAPGNHAFVWDGTDDLGDVVPDEAYVYVLTAGDGTGRTDQFAPSGGRGVGSGSGAVDSQYNPYTNDFWEMIYNNASGGRVTMQVTPSGGSTFDVFTMEPHEVGSFLIVWDGRDDTGQIVEVNSSVYFPPPTTFRPNYILTTGDTPRLDEIQSDPYVMNITYGQVTDLQYSLLRDAEITVKILPPGIADPDDPSAIVLVDAQPHAPGTYTVLWDGLDPGDPNGNLAEVLDEGPYTFAVQANNTSTGTTALARGVINVFR